MREDPTVDARVGRQDRRGRRRVRGGVRGGPRAQRAQVPRRRERRQAMRRPPEPASAHPEGQGNPRWRSGRHRERALGAPRARVHRAVRVQARAGSRGVLHAVRDDSYRPRGPTNRRPGRPKDPPVLRASSADRRRVRQVPCVGQQAGHLTGHV